MKIRLTLILSVLSFSLLTACSSTDQEPEAKKKQGTENTGAGMSEMLSGEILTKVQNSLDEAAAISQEKRDIIDDMTQDIEDDYTE